MTKKDGQQSKKKMMKKMRDTYLQRVSSSRQQRVEKVLKGVDVENEYAKKHT